ncbi:MAG: hypothetical protein LBV04_01735 [Deferribacteraceae bacterium]|jgi:hypothetical protein|nr:hypothetical protein [Deferribacteraceae bacterium]
MSWSKRITVAYLNIEAAEEDYFSKFHENMETILESGNTSGIFEAGQLKYTWRVAERVDIDESATYFFTLVRERISWPVWVNDDGNYAELSLPQGSLGDISFGFVNPAYKTLLCFAAGAGGCVSGFKKLLGQFSPEGVVRLTPYFEEHIDEKVLAWDCYKKVSFSFNMPSGEDVTEFANTKAGELTKIISFLGGLKADVTVSAGGGKELLSNMMVKDILPELLENDLCKSLTVRGSDFENSSQEQYDLKNAQVKYMELLEVEGNYITESDAKQLLVRAVNERHSMIFNPR